MVKMRKGIDGRGGVEGLSEDAQRAPRSFRDLSPEKTDEEPAFTNNSTVCGDEKALPPSLASRRGQ